MGGIANMVMLLLCIALAFALVFPTKITANPIGKTYNMTKAFDPSNLTTNINIPLLAGTVSFPNPFSLFSSFFEMIASFINMPWEVMGLMESLPSIIKSFLFTVIALLLILGAINVWRGSDKA